MRRPSSEHLVFAASFLGSLALHLPLYGGLGYLAKSVPPKGFDDPVTELEVVVGEPAVEPRPDDVADPAERPPARRPRPVPEPAPPAASRPAPPRPTPAVPAPPQPAVARPTPPRPPPPDRAAPQAIEQRSQDPSVEPPPDSRFIASENSRVDEETVARIRNHQRDDAQTSPGRRHRASEPEPGNDDTTDVEDAREVEGSDARTATEREARAPRPRQASTTPPPESATRGASPRAEDAAGGDGRAGGDSGGATPAPGGAPADGRFLTVDDGQGRFVVAVPRPRRGEGGPGAEGQASEAEGTGRAGAGRGRGPAGSGAGRGGARGTTRGDLDLDVSWSQFEQVYGEAELREERAAVIRERRSRLRGSNDPTRGFERFRAAIENYVPGVKPGNQTALNARASPFAAYLAAVHRRIHRQFADRYLTSLPSWGGDPHSDRSLMTKLEIILNRDGTVHRIGVVRTSGLVTFDYGAYTAVMRGQPYPAPPSQILSGDGKVYFHWGFYRNERQCGTFNAEPYILDAPPGSGDGQRPSMRDGPDEGTVVPPDARPSWGDDPGDGSDRDAPDGDRPAPPRDGDRPREVPAIPPGAALG